MWTPRFACPDCSIELSSAWCLRCGRSFERIDGIWRFLTAARREALAPFVQQYRFVRVRDGHRRQTPDFYRALPSVDRADPDAAEWRIRRETYGNLLRHVLAEAPQAVRVLDLGAGSGWLCHRLAELGHQPVAVDIVDDDADGLGTTRHYATEFPAVQADFGRLPFVSAQFDLVVFNASLHYAPDALAALAGACRMLAPGGALGVMDSPMFDADADGRAMRAAKAGRFRSAYGLASVLEPGAGYVTFATLNEAARTLEMRPAFIPSRGPFGWRARRQWARVRLGRAPATFGLWVARRPPQRAEERPSGAPA